MYVWMDGCMCELMGGWMFGWMDGCMGAWMDKTMYVCMCE